MIKQIAFIITLLTTLGIFSYSTYRIYTLFKLCKPAFPIKDIWKRLVMTFNVVFLQTKIFRRPVIGLIHALVFWGFLVICVGSIEMCFDGILGIENTFKVFGPVYQTITIAGDLYAYIVAICIVIFLVRRVVLKVKRFEGAEMKRKFYVDANIALSLILLLMLSLIAMNITICLKGNHEGTYPISQFLVGDNPTDASYNFLFETFWWIHILLVFFFANYLPYSKHFHVFMSIPNVFISRLEPLGKLPNMESITKEVKIMLYPELMTNETLDNAAPSRFGVKDVEDVSWKNFFDSLACTQCGRCTSVCPANITGKLLSPRKLFIDLRARMNEKGPKLVKQGKEYSDNKSYIKDFISTEEIWACTLCNACAKECPVNINHPTLIVDLRRYLVMEEASAPSSLNSIFTNIENNGAPWQFSPQDRLLWAE